MTHYWCPNGIVHKEYPDEDGDTICVNHVYKGCGERVNATIYDEDGILCCPICGELFEPLPPPTVQTMIDTALTHVEALFEHAWAVWRLGLPLKVDVLTALTDARDSLVDANIHNKAEKPQVWPPPVMVWFNDVGDDDQEVVIEMITADYDDSVYAGDDQ